MIDFTLGICCLSRDFPAYDPAVPADWVASDACAVVFQLCRFRTLFARAYAEINAFRVLFLFFCRASIYTFSFLFAAVTNLLLGLLPVEKKTILRKHRDVQFIPWSSHLWQKILLLVFHSKLQSIFVYMQKVLSPN